MINKRHLTKSHLTTGFQDKIFVHRLHFPGKSLFIKILKFLVYIFQFSLGVIKILDQLDFLGPVQI